jgi:hypothetical protein
MKEIVGGRARVGGCLDVGERLRRRPPRLGLRQPSQNAMEMAA